MKKKAFREKYNKNDEIVVEDKKVAETAQKEPIKANRKRTTKK